MKNEKKKPWTARRLHLWVAIIVAIPMLLVAVSGVLIAMRGVTQIQVPMSWMGAESTPDRLPIMSYAEGPGDVVWLGNAQGLNKIHAGGVESIANFEGQEVVGLAVLKDHAMPVVATRMAVWVEKDGEWTAVRRGRVRQLNTLSDGRVLAISGGRGELADGRPFVTSDGDNWQIYKPAMQANKKLPELTEPKVALHQFMRELHSGAFFFGKGLGERVWSNVLGWTLVLLSLTGLWMWVKQQRQKAKERAALLQGSTS
ncbi:MAG: hypothetical protein B7Y59_10835 [Burkholderiales bacterium 35-55-47]|jgi:hypothetical protein|uniref:PepSY domain-containing protein n=1 Tax=Limnohabitans sp. TaxID=1907725 RepID=UPI000BC52FEB|nr:PepSY domain-containing protein [Limnohabitans sp.]OYY17797.1 MAG: hypothetical protein B7Y59_10835 [Burkholderiales bacterium 35-55-47]OYZ72266.1 MAG: hypothetical protein B7Y06_11730 [Burkholderiales bacterium 24-55-52]OZA99638.1 MAG: hypothetical protein B7X62_10215 [Burkholderiales bacterium 39-55-53]HQR86759.1 PepSY domain-containing protein [Limnohabitans sp.]HQS27144.1 PepSY domain-containing protein [Limnohabitans sp.]